MSTRPGPKPNVEVDLTLAVLVAVTPPGYAWSESDLAEMLGIDHARVNQIEQEALKKLRTRSHKSQRVMNEIGLTYTQCRPTSPKHQRAA